MANELIAMAVLAANIFCGISGLLAARAWWPRHDIRIEPKATQVFYVSIVGLTVAFGGDTTIRAIDIVMNWPPSARLSVRDDLLWRVLAGFAFMGMIWSKLLALPADERSAWNLLTVCWHPDPDHSVVRVFNAAARLMRRRKGI